MRSHIRRTESLHELKIDTNDDDTHKYSMFSLIRSHQQIIIENADAAENI